MLTFSEFENILQLIASDDLECRILGQELAKQYKFGGKRPNYYNDLIYLDNTNYIVFKDGLHSFLEDMLQIYLMNEHMKNILPPLTQEEFKNILHLIMSQDSECRVLGQTLAKHYGF